MAQVTHLSKAPIVEAVVEFQVDLPSDGILSAARKAHKQVEQDYPQSKKLVSGSLEFHFHPGGRAPTSTSSSKETGMRFTSADGKRIVDFGMKAFAFHWLAPYSEWDDLRAESKRLWEIYVQSMKPRAITRLGVRFINNLSIPQSVSDLCDYLVPGPIVPPGLPQSLQSFLSRIEIADVSHKRIGIIAQALRGLSEDGNFSVVLDIDAIRAESFATTDPAIWGVADSLRDFKNDIFFNSVTDRLLEQYR